MLNAIPFTRDLVLVGGGHAHALVLKFWGMKPLPGVRLTVINPEPMAPYTGMLPGYIAGHSVRDLKEVCTRNELYNGGQILRKTPQKHLQWKNLMAGRAPYPNFKWPQWPAVTREPTL